MNNHTHDPNESNLSESTKESIESNTIESNTIESNTIESNTIKSKRSRKSSGSKRSAELSERPAFELLESLRLEKGSYWLLGRHLERLQIAAAHYGYPVDISRVQEQLALLATEPVGIAMPGGMHVSDKPTNVGEHNLADAGRHSFTVSGEDAAGQIWKVRCLVTASGDIRLERELLEPDGKFPLSVALAQRPVARDEPQLYYKTTQRDIYDSHLEEAKSLFCGVYDVLLWNKEDELTEFTRGNVVANVRGRMVTPPTACGLLGGVLRAELLAKGEVREQIIRRDDLAHTTGMWLINSVRGWLPVRLVNNPHAIRRI